MALIFLYYTPNAKTFLVYFKKKFYFLYIFCQYFIQNDGLEKILVATPRLR